MDCCMPSSLYTPLIIPRAYYTLLVIVRYSMSLFVSCNLEEVVVVLVEGNLMVGVVPVGEIPRGVVVRHSSGRGQRATVVELCRNQTECSYNYNQTKLPERSLRSIVLSR